MRKLILFLSVIIVLTACNSRKSNEYVINGTIKGNFTGDVYLQKATNGQFEIIDTAKVESGKFKFEGTIDMPDLYYIGLDASRFVSFFIEPANIKMEFHVDSLRNPVVEGSASDKEFRQYEQKISDNRSAQIGLYTQYQEASRLNDTVKVAALEKEIEGLDAKLKAELISFIKDNPKSYVSPYIAMRHAYELDLAELQDIHSSLDSKVKESPFTKMIDERVAILENVAVGKPAPDFTMNDNEGNPFTLSSTRGKVVLVDFWASWCGPCRKENPNVVAAYKEYNKQGFDIVGVSLDRDEVSWKEAIKADKLTWIHVSDLQYWNNAVSKQYGVMSIPSNILLDKNGVIIARDLQGEELTKKLAEVFAAV